MARRRRRAEQKQQPDLSRQTSVRWDRWLWLVIVACSLGAYATSFEGAFLFDEDRHILQNESIRSLWPLGPVLSASRRPLVNLSLAINYAVGGLDVWGYHAFNVCVHILGGLVLFGVVRRTLARSPWDEMVGVSGPWLAASTALIWVVHPLNTQAVTYIIQRGESIYGGRHCLESR